MNSTNEDVLPADCGGAADDGGGHGVWPGHRVHGVAVGQGVAVDAVQRRQGHHRLLIGGFKTYQEAVLPSLEDLI